MSGFGTNGQNGSASGTNTVPSPFGPPPTSNASQSSSTAPTPNASGTTSSPDASRQQNAPPTQSLFGPPVPSASTATSTGGGFVFGPAPIAPAPGSITRASVYGTGTSATTTPPTSGGSSSFGPTAVQGGLGSATGTNSSSAPVSGLFGSATAGAAPTSTSSGLFGSGAVSTPTTSFTAASLFGIITPIGTGAPTTDSSSSSALNQSQTNAAQSSPTGESSGDTPPTMATASNTSDATGTNEREGSALPERNVINIDTDGDLLLDVGGDEESELSQPQRFRVCSSALRRHSPVWKQMLFGPWKESKPANAESEEWIVELPGDSLKPMHIVLSIIHGRFNHVPPFLSLDELYELLILTNKYDMTDVVRLWCAQWAPVAHGDLSSADTLKSLFTAWELGHEDLFALRIEEISVNTSFENKALSGTGNIRFRKSNLAGAPVVGDEEWIDLERQDYLGPHDIVDIIGAIRREALLMIMRPLANDYSTRKFPSISTACSGRPQSDAATIFVTGSPALCDAAILGGLTIHIDSRFINTPKLSSITESVVQVASSVFPKIGKIEVLPQHPLCSLHTKYSILNKKIHEKLPGLVARHLKPWQRKYMESQREKTGIEFPRSGQKQRQANTRRYW
ncbi:hypothetical protein QBC45DRAFT_360118 [Copromyces sp. CBS 386.78]|nr:hypothetical protein QBC45DRAFT_360118 [Copromyces sp. CBS 386.78]